MRRNLMALALHRRGRGGFRWLRRLIFGLIIVSFGICIVTALVFMFFQNIPTRPCPSACYYDCSFQDFLPISCRFISYNNSVKEIEQEMIEELRKDRVTLIKEELDLLKKVSEENMETYKSLMENTKKSSFVFRKEAENCNIGVRTCEDARERSQKLLLEEYKLTALWQKRAKRLAKRKLSKIRE